MLLSSSVFQELRSQVHWTRGLYPLVTHVNAVKRLLIATESQARLFSRLNFDKVSSKKEGLKLITKKNTEIAFVVTFDHGLLFSSHIISFVLQFSILNCPIAFYDQTDQNKINYLEQEEVC